MAGFYTIERQDGRWWFIRPDGARFWSIGMNHIDFPKYSVYRECTKKFRGEHD